MGWEKRRHKGTLMKCVGHILRINKATIEGYESDDYVLTPIGCTLKWMIFSIEGTTWM